MQNSKNFRIGIIVALFACIVGAVFFFKQFSEYKKIELHDEVSSAPQKNTLYYGTYQNYPAFFFTSTYVQEASQENDPYYGQFWGASESGRIDFRKLSGFKKVFSSKQDILDIDNIFPIKSSDSIYVSLNYSKDNPNFSKDIPRSTVIQINLQDLSTQQVWPFDTTTSAILEKYRAMGRGMHVADKYLDGQGEYLTMEVVGCTDCTVDRQPMYIINTKTHNLVMVDEPGNLKFNLPSHTFSYQKRTPVTTQIDKNNFRTAWNPSGAVITEPLP